MFSTVESLKPHSARFIHALPDTYFALLEPPTYRSPRAVGRIGVGVV